MVSFAAEMSRRYGMECSWAGAVGVRKVELNEHFQRSGLEPRWQFVKSSKNMRGWKHYLKI